ncbi:putative Tropinone reductase [Cocos nucifera]|nr:putative Tropinone reductase [Cocos nucifera]
MKVIQVSAGIILPPTTRTLAKELRGMGITANSMAPRPMAMELFLAGKTKEDVRWVAEQSLLGQLGKPEDMAGVVGFL